MTQIRSSNAEMIIVALALLIGFTTAGHSRYSGFQESYGPPLPYQFGYSAQDQEGRHGHSQMSDGRRVQGHYVIQLADGRQRRVDYIADENGFRAKVVTNEPGTESKDAADATYHSTAVSGQYAPQRFHGRPAHRFNRRW